jgi:hypothetical protein
MQPTPVKNTSNNRNYPLTQEHRSRLYQILNDLDINHLHFLLATHLPNSPVLNKSQHYTHSQILQQCLILIDNYYSAELEQTLFNLTQKRIPSDLYHHYQQQQQQQQPHYYTQQPMQYSPPPNYRFTPTPTIPQQLRPSK